VLALRNPNDIDLSSAGRQRSESTANAKEHQFGCVPKIETNTSAIRPTVFANLMPDYVRLVSETPSLHHRQSFSK
jgi:hypothetical protein